MRCNTLNCTTCQPMWATPPTKCYVCYRKKEPLNCTVLNGDNNAFVNRFTREIAEQWVYQFNLCMNRCPNDIAELTTFADVVLKKMLEGSLPSESFFRCRGNSCEYLNKQCLLPPAPASTSCIVPANNACCTNGRCTYV